MMPPDPVSDLASSASYAHEMFTAYIKAGFSRKEALYLIGVVIAEANRQATASARDDPDEYR